MQISGTTAMRIVSELSGIIQQKVNLMDENGIIIASTDEARIGTCHKGSQKILTEHLEKLIIYKDEERDGVRKGVNLPIEVNDRYIGVVGITGEYDEVAKYGHIIKKMTEILILDYERNEHRRMERTARSRFVREWVMNGVSPTDRAFPEQASAFGIDYKIPRRMIVFSESMAPLTDQEENLMHLEWLERTITRVLSREKEHLLFNNGKKYVLLIPEKTDEQIRTLCDSLQRAVCPEGNSMLLIGADSRTADIYSMKEAYLRADKAWYFATQTKTADPVFYGDLKLELLIHEIPAHLRKEYMEKMFAGYDEKEIRELCGLLGVLYECNGSIQKACDRLFLHKNTLQYKLNKIAEKTGVNPRTMPGAALFYLATEFLKMEQDDSF